MRAVVQRVTEARVLEDERELGRIGRGLVVLLGVGKDDTEADCDYLADKIAGLRVFADERSHMNLSLADVDGQALVVSQFTLYGDCRKGRRPSFTDSAPPEEAERLYEDFVARLSDRGVPVSTGRFGGMMTVELANDGPVTLLMDSKKEF